jgi:hypothetical protein
VLANAAGDGGPGGRRYADVALLSAVSACFALGTATLERYNHLAAADALPLAGLAGLPAGAPATRSPRNCPPTLSTRPPRSPCCAPGGAACIWYCGCSPTTPSTGWPPTSTPTCATTTSTGSPPAR